MKSLKEYIGLFLELAKVRITLFVAVSTSLGYILQKGQFDFGILIPTLAVFILAGGSSSFNHYQERKLDALMERTKGRPIPSGRISGKGALIYSSILTAIGLLALYFFANLASALLGLTALVWYNLIYTPLKMKYALAVVPGSVIGAIPPVIGYVAAGGDPLSPQFLSIALFFFIWQIPHFWLLLMIYSKDYEEAGFPTLTRIFSRVQLGRITFMWIAALATSCLIITAINFPGSYLSLAVFLILGFWLVWETKGILSGCIERLFIRKAFVIVNTYVLAVTVIISIDKLLLQDI